jgi:hypothetical protein
VDSAIAKRDSPVDMCSLDDFTSEHQLICTKLQAIKVAKLSTCHAGAQLVAALRYKVESRGFDSVEFFIILPALGSNQPITEMSNRIISWGKKR